MPEGPAWGRLQRGEPVTGDGGGEVRPEQVLGPDREGRKIAYITDTRPCRGAVELARGADLVFMEGMFEDEMADEANKKGHQSVLQAAQQLREAEARRAVIVHWSPRYANDDLERVLEPARDVFPALEAGRDLARYEIPVKG
ncbi:MAG: MBL fold metallo-hydrolase [Deltaproteobacteria bacterium]|nr:MBL fold metallo-hydrolase [Deltaproteobacteria bacterium]